MTPKGFITAGLFAMGWGGLCLWTVPTTGWAGIVVGSGCLLVGLFRFLQGCYDLVKENYR